MDRLAMRQRGRSFLTSPFGECKVCRLLAGVGWWVICGDCPTDYTTRTGDRTPRAAVDDFSSRWRAASVAMLRGERLPDFSVGNSENAGELAPLLESRARLLAEWSLDATLWEAQAPHHRPR